MNRIHSNPKLRRQFLGSAKQFLFKITLGTVVALSTSSALGVEETFVNPNETQEASNVELASLLVSSSNSQVAQDNHRSSQTNGSSRGNTRVQEFLQQSIVNVEWKKMAASLAIVIGGYLAFIWLVRAFHGGNSQSLPKQVVEVIGQAPFNSKQTMQLVRLGNKLLLLLVGPEGTQAIGEVTDPVEVETLIGMCRPNRNSRRGRSVDPRHVPTRAPGAGSGANMMEQFVATLQRALQNQRGQTEYEA
jgi:flagellar biogenesis protein FliO